uniref:urease accessory protein UreF n=1 Tax=Aquibium sp. A9E412 TaxID=2976767 RepID=UPI00339D62C4
MRPGLLPLMAWLSPAFPTGGFAYSGGLEAAVADGMPNDEATLGAWLATLLGHGAPRNDAILLAAAWRAADDRAALDRLAGLAAALAGSAERHAETLAQGASFHDAAGAWFAGRPPCRRETALPVALGAACGAAGVALPDALAGFLQAFVSAQLQAAIRLSVTGQAGAARLLAALGPAVAAAAAQAAAATPDDLGSAAMLAEIAAMRHETLAPRLFLS